MESTVLLVLASIGAFFMAFNNGANDVSNAFASAVGSKALGMRRALVFASVFTFLGAFLLGGKVAFRLVEGIVEPGYFVNSTHYALAMLAVLFSAGTFVLISTLTGLPVSSTHSIVGSLMGVNAFVLGWDALDWRGIGTIALFWVVSPIGAGLFAFLLIFALETYVLEANKSAIKVFLRKQLPWAGALLASLVGIFLLKMAPHPKLAELSILHVGLIGSGIFAGVGFGLRFLGQRWLRRYRQPKAALNQAFLKLQTTTACAVAFGNGANDVSNSISPVLAIVWVIGYGHVPTAEDAPTMPLWILLIGGFGIVCGILTLGHRVMDTLGRKITTLTPTRGFGIDLAVATILIGSSAFGLPISTTHAATGAVMGAGLARGARSLRMGLLAKIFLAWVLTVPLAALLTIVLYYLLLLIQKSSAIA